MPPSHNRVGDSTLYNTVLSFCLAFLLHIPRYFLHQAVHVIFTVGSIYAQPLDVIDNPPTQTHEYLPTYDGDNNSIGAAAPHSTLDARSTYESYTSFPSAEISHSSPETLSERLQARWGAYIVARSLEWGYIVTLASVIAGASPAILQLPEASGPFIRSVIYLAILRAIAAIAYASLLLVYTRQPQVNTAKFAIVWVNSYRYSPLCMPWTIFAFPAVALAWALILLSLSFFLAVWCTVCSPGPSTTSTGATMWTFPPPPVRIIITIPSVLDLACLIWLWKTLKRYKDDSAKVEDI
ncbi:hypothetical protein DXG01_007014 [Tephrocybe rancida]|nr:hypothetical protein DXG01_007014 [Tephrocybe rancida]